MFLQIINNMHLNGNILMTYLLVGVLISQEFELCMFF